MHDLISGAKAGFTINSGVGLEALLHSRPVVVTGECDYSSPSRSDDELKKHLNHEFVFDQPRDRKLLHYYVNTYSMAANERAAIESKLANWLNG